MFDGLFARLDEKGRLVLTRVLTPGAEYTVDVDTNGVIELTPVKEEQA